LFRFEDIREKTRRGPVTAVAFLLPLVGALFPIAGVFYLGGAAGSQRRPGVDTIHP
jgi:hypothetical protein